MYMGRIGTRAENEIADELQGARVLLTGLTAASGVDVARGFAHLRSKLIIHTNDLSPEVTEVIALVSQSAREIKLYTDSITEADASVRLAQSAAQAFGGLDAVINLSSISKAETDAVESDADAERLVAAKLSPLAHLTAVTANRMRVVMSEGVILNVMQMAAPANARESAIASLMRTALATMTKTEALKWEDNGIRINAIGPGTLVDATGATAGQCANEPDIAALSIYLMSRHGASLSGHIFDLESAA